MSRAQWVVIALFIPPLVAASQAIIHSETESAIIWSGPQCEQSDTPLGGHEALCDGITTAHPEASSLVQDPLTGTLLRKINYEGVEVSTTLSAFDVGCGWSECYTAYVAKFTIINDSDDPLVIDGSTFQSTLRAPTVKEIRKWWGKRANPRDFASGSSRIIEPGRSDRLTFYMIATGQTSNITKWFNHSFFDVVPIRYSIRVRSKDFVFPWLAPLHTNFDAVPKWDY